MDNTDANHLLAVLSTVLAAIALPPAAAVPVLTLLVGYLAGRYARNPT